MHTSMLLNFFAKTDYQNSCYRGNVDEHQLFTLYVQSMELMGFKSKFTTQIRFYKSWVRESISNTNQISNCLIIPSMTFLCLLWMQMQGIRYSVTSCVCFKFPSPHRRVLYKYNDQCRPTLFEYACLQSKTAHFHYV